jgi:hypothetical protein
MPGQTLRQLARAYARGEVDREHYRRSRTLLIERILAGETPIDDNEPPPSAAALADISQEFTMPPAAEALADPDFDITAFVPERSGEPAAAVTPPKRAEPAPAGRSAMLGAGALVVAIALLIGYFIWKTAGAPRESAPVAAMTAEDAAQQLTAAAAESDAVPERQETEAPEAAALIRGFLQARNWSDDSLGEFLTLWQALPAEQREASTGSAEIAQLTSAIYRQMLEERALSRIGNAEQSVAKQQTLARFAREIGINDPRITVPD